MNLIRSDKSAACNAIRVALLHVFCWPGGRMDGWPAFCKQVKWILRSSTLLFCLASDRSAQGATRRHAPCLSPSTKLTYSRLSALILLHCQWCRRTPLRLALHTVSPQCINGHWLLAPADILLFCCSSSLHSLPKYPRCGSARGFMMAGEMMAGPKESWSLL